jgi:hypothetical protein
MLLFQNVNCRGKNEFYLGRVAILSNEEKKQEKKNKKQNKLFCFHHHHQPIRRRCNADLQERGKKS